MKRKRKKTIAKRSEPKKVIIVESPTKCKTIKGFLSDEYVLVSSRGHIKDLPKSTLGVDVENNFEPKYIKIKGKAKIINEIKKTCKNALTIFLAPDPDREGEAIAQHLAEELNSSAPAIKRALFYEITPDYVRNALKNTTTINMNLVDAHKARRILDRIVGYYTSPLLWTIIKSGLSAGRVQSVALRLVCEREQEITAFEPTPYWTATAEYKTAANDTLLATLFRIDGAVRKIATKEELERFRGLAVKGSTWAVTSFKVTNPRRFPPPPFKTSTLQQEAARRFNFNARKTMYIAQQLYEGIDLPQGSIGLVTYMRTDSIRVNKKAVEDLRNYITGKYGDDYLSKPARIYKDSKNVQGGHEAIRPTRTIAEPESVKKHLTTEQYKIYKLIYDRFVASQMSAAKYRKKEAVVSFMGIDFKAEELKPIFPGFQLVAGDISERGAVPELSVGDSVTLQDMTFEEKQTEPSPRYTEASLIKKLEENGVGRPSTYAHIMQTLFDRGYAERSEGKMKATELGMQVYNIIIPRFKNIFEVSFTAKMETKLDLIEVGKKSWQEVVQEFYNPFFSSFSKTKKEVSKIKESITEKVDKKCPKCSLPLVIRWGKYGKFLACSGFPDCKYSENLEVEKSEKQCPKCGKILIVKHGRFGKFLACSGYPNCRYTENLPHDAPCTQCGGEVIIISTKRGRIYKCKHCEFSTFYPPVAEKCPKCGKGLVAQRGKNICLACNKKKKKK